MIALEMQDEAPRIDVKNNACTPSIWEPNPGASSKRLVVMPASIGVSHHSFLLIPPQIRHAGGCGICGRRLLS